MMLAERWKRIAEISQKIADLAAASSEIPDEDSAAGITFSLLPELKKAVGALRERCPQDDTSGFMCRLMGACVTCQGKGYIWRQGVEVELKFDKEADANQFRVKLSPAKRWRPGGPELNNAADWKRS